MLRAADDSGGVRVAQKSKSKSTTGSKRRSARSAAKPKKAAKAPGKKKARGGSAKVRAKAKPKPRPKPKSAQVARKAKPAKIVTRRSAAAKSAKARPAKARTPTVHKPKLKPPAAGRAAVAAHKRRAPKSPRPSTTPLAAPPVAAPAPTPAKPAGPPPLRIRTRPLPAAAPRATVPLPPLDFDAIRARLAEKKKEILAMYLNDLRTGQESNDSPTEDIVDRANNAYSRELNFSISDAERALLLQVEEAIERIEDGVYGNCAHCGQPIPRPRLAAIPWARLCIQCQELHEQGLLAEA